MTNTSPEAERGWSPETVIVIGAKGFIGRNLVDALKGKAGRLVAVDVAPGNVGGVPCVSFDNLEAMDFGANTVVIHLAAVGYDASNFSSGQSNILLRNVEITGRIYEFCVRKQIREVRLASSIAVYPAEGDPMDDGAPLDLLRDPHDGELMYGWSKRIGEIYARLYRQKLGIETVAFRLTNPYGPYDSVREEKAHVVPAFVIRALTSSGPFAIRGNPEASRDFVYVTDVCEVFIRSLAWRGRSDAFNVGCGQNTTVSSLAKSVLRLVGSEREIVASGKSVSAVEHRGCDNAKLRAAIGMTRFVSLDEGLKPTIEWYRHAVGQ